MNNNVVFDNDNNNSDSNAELLKKNTPNTVDYDKLYNTNKIPVNNIKQDNNIHDINDTITNINTTNNNNNNITNNNNNINTNVASNNNPEEPKKKKGLDSLLFVFLLFIIIMGIIMFIFPLFGNLLFK